MVCLATIGLAWWVSGRGSFRPYVIPQSRYAEAEGEAEAAAAACNMEAWKQCNQAGNRAKRDRNSCDPLKIYNTIFFQKDLWEAGK